MTTVREIRIAGAGPAGLTTAAALIAASEAPERVVVHEAVDEAAAVGTGAFLGLSPSVFGALGRFGSLEVLFREAPTIGAIRLVQPDGADVTRPLPGPLCMVTRRGLVAALLDGVRESGVEVRFGSAVTQDDSFDGWTVGADGVHSVVRRFAGFEHLPAPIAPGISARFAPRFTGTAPDLDRDVLTFFRGDRGAAAGFLAGDHGVLAFTRTPDGATLGELGFRLNDAVLDALDGGCDAPIRVWETSVPESVGDGGNPWRAGRSLLIGDAAHAKSPASGSGAADAITDALHLAPALHSRSDDAVTAAMDELLARERARRIPGPPR